MYSGRGVRKCMYVVMNMLGGVATGSQTSENRKGKARFLHILMVYGCVKGDDWGFLLCCRCLSIERDVFAQEKCERKCVYEG